MKHSPQFAVLLKQLSALSTSELGEIRQRVSFLLGTKPKPKDNQDWLLEGLVLELRRRGLWSGGTLPSRFLPTDYFEKAELVRQHLLKGISDPNPRLVERMSVAGLAASVLVDYLQKIRVPVTPKTVLMSIDKVPVALEEAFPGYWSGKLLGSCIKA